ncbi:MAG: hypothetical protein RLZZ293_222 [Pseudomonadota bacterium]|jgi:hypothetical protein
MQLNLVLAGLIWREEADLSYLSNYLHLDNFNYLFKRAKIKPSQLKYSDFIYHNAKLANSPATSLAQFYAQNLGLTNYAHYLLAEPTNLRSDRDRLLVSESELLQLDNSEALQIISELNHHFNGEIVVYSINPELWLIATNLPLELIPNYPLIDIIGENIANYLPRAKANLTLHKLITEIQMLLFNLPLNQLREEEGLPILNSLWLWDKPLSSNLQSNSFNNSLSNNSRLGSPLSNLAQQINKTNWLILDSAYFACCYRDSHAWIELVNQLDREIGSLFIDKLRRGQIKQLNIYLVDLENSWQLTLNRFDVWKFWRKTLPNFYNRF